MCECECQGCCKTATNSLQKSVKNLRIFGEFFGGDRKRFIRHRLTRFDFFLFIFSKQEQKRHRATTTFTSLKKIILGIFKGKHSVIFSTKMIRVNIMYGVSTCQVGSFFGTFFLLLNFLLVSRVISSGQPGFVSLLPLARNWCFLKCKVKVTTAKN